MALRIGRFSVERLKLDALYNIYLGMNSKEQTVAMVVAGIVVLLVIILPVTLASSRIGKLEESAGRGREQIREVMRSIEVYDGRRAQLRQLQELIGGGFDSSLSTTLETLAEKNGIKENIDSLKEKAVAPSEIFDEASVDVRIKRISLEKLIEYLQEIENNNNSLLRLKKLSIKKRFDNQQELDVTFTVSTYRLLEGAEEGV